MSFLKGIFAKKLTVSEQVNLWKKNIRGEIRVMERNIREMKREEKKTITEMKKVARQNQVDTVKILAKNIVQIRKGIQRLYMTRAQLNSVKMKIEEQYSQARMMKAFQVSADIMSEMNKLCNMKDATMAMKTMQKEMAKAGMIEEMTGDMLDDTFDDDVEVEDTVATVLKEVVGEQLANVAIGNEALPEAKKEVVTTKEDKEMAERLAALQDI